MRDYLRLLFIATIFALYGFTISQLRAAETRESTEAGIRANMELNMEACNQEDMQKLLGLMAKEIPNRQRFITTVDQFWSVSDTYNRLENVEVLEYSDAPNGNTRYPYATAKIRQTTRYVTARQNERAVWRRVCADGKCDSSEMEHLMAVAPRAETVEFEALFKHENGEWKLVANVSIPVEPGQPSKYPRVRRSVF